MSVSFLCSLLHIASSGLCLYVTTDYVPKIPLLNLPVQMLYFIQKEHAHTQATKKNLCDKMTQTQPNLKSHSNRCNGLSFEF